MPEREGESSDQNIRPDEVIASSLYEQQVAQYSQASKEGIDHIELDEMLHFIESLNLLHGNILDVGAGTGQLLRRVLESSNDFHIDAIDLNKQFVDELNQIPDPRLHRAEEMSFNDLTSLPDAFYDTVIANFALNYSEDLQIPLKQIAAKLISNGYLVFTIVVANQQASPRPRLPGTLNVNGTIIDVHAYQYTAEEVTQTLTDTGYRPIMLRTFKPPYYNLDREQVPADLEVLTALFVAQKT